MNLFIVLNPVILIFAIIAVRFCQLKSAPNRPYVFVGLMGFLLLGLVSLLGTVLGIAQVFPYSPMAAFVYRFDSIVQYWPKVGGGMTVCGIFLILMAILTPPHIAKRSVSFIGLFLLALVGWLFVETMGVSSYFMVIIKVLLIHLSLFLIMAWRPDVTISPGLQDQLQAFLIDFGRVGRWIMGLPFGLAVLLMLAVRPLDDVTASGAFPVIVALGLIFYALMIDQWSRCNYSMDVDSLPGWFKILGMFVGMVLLIQVNVAVCQWRLGTNITPNFLQALIGQSVAFGLALGLCALMWGEKAEPASFNRLLGIVILSIVLISLLNMLFHMNIGDLEAKSLPTRRCHPGGACYNVGNEQWGGMGALLVMSINIFQLMLVLNIVCAVSWMVQGSRK